MTRWWASYRVTVRFAVLEQVRNRDAMAIWVLITPVWVTVFYQLLPAAGAPCFVRPAGRTVTIAGAVLAQVSAGVQMNGLLVGLMMFLATARATAFDRRLVSAGCPRVALVLGKMTALGLAAVATAVYTTACMRFFWRPHDLVLLAAALTVVALIYGCFGIALAAAVRGELGGAILMVFLSFVDAAVASPIATGVATNPHLRFLPAYGVMQSAITAIQLSIVPYRYLALGLLWAAAAAAVGIFAFAVRTRSHRSHVSGLTGPAALIGARI